ncbi:MAG TPA: hypothetical protein PLS20_03600 [Ruminococcus flavefaciens]|nr:hypothetical protein [Ruminococcus flavefaciens]
MKTNLIQLYVDVKNNLEELAEKQGVFIEKYYHPNCSDWHSNPTNYFEELCADIQDGGYISGVIGYWGEYAKDKDNRPILVKDIISDIFSGFQYSKALQFADWKQLMNYFCEAMPYRISKEKHWIEDESKDTKPNTMWQQYVKGLYDGAEYLARCEQFKCTRTLDEFVKATPESVEDVKALLYQLRGLWSNISGMGIPFCYNWIKECGAVWLAKPDLHINRIVNSIIEHNFGSWDEFIAQTPAYAKYETVKRKPKVYYEERVALFIWEWAKIIKDSGVDAEITSYKLDRILYLYCTNGRFYLDTNNDRSISEAGLLNMICNE